MCSFRASTQAERVEIREVRKHQAVVLDALGKADRAGQPVLFLQLVREAVPWAAKLSDGEFDEFLGEFLRADWRQEGEAAAIVTRWMAFAGER
jgi:hypothetical protein